MRIYFSGIGGVGIGPLAEIADDAGYSVVGSDLAKSSITEALEARGITIHIGQDGSALESEHAARPIDWFVYTSALPPEHPELVFAQSHGIKTSKRDELLAAIIEDKQLKLLAVAGTHGKTTVTAMIVWLFQTLNRPVSYSIGAPISFGPSGAYDDESTFFVYECDEFDRNFLHFTPFIAAIPSIDYDHIETYPTQQEYQHAFATFIKQSKVVFMWQHDADYVGVLGEPNVHTLTSREQPTDGIPLFGEHYRHNARIAAAAVSQATGTPVESILGLIERFPGTHRRFEQLEENIYSDYGHHPTEIAAVLQMASEINEHIVLVYQPHQNRRQHELQNQYTDCMRDAEAIYWLPTYLSREDPAQAILSPEQLSAHLVNRAAVQYPALDDGLWQTIKQAQKEGKLVIVMGAGSVDGWLREQIATAKH